jgi:UDP-N-acetylmuramoyl-tripeptide--D-alanyl-D-alanine ligase
MRSEVQRINRMTIINDCYNANPASMRAAIRLLTELGDGRRTIAVLGDMLELGSETEQLHREIGEYVAASGVNELVTCGALGQIIGEAAERAGLATRAVHRAADAPEAAVLLKGMVRSDDVVLVKASRGMRMERIVEALKPSR